MRGIKTLAVRMDRQQANAIQIADFLQAHKFKVHYPGLKSHPQYELHAKMSRGPGAVLSFETGNVELSEKLVELTRLWGISVSFGCVNSLIRYVLLLLLLFFICLFSICFLLVIWYQISIVD